MIIGVVADDTTGANDIGVMFSKNGYLTKIVGFDEKSNLVADTDVIIVDTDSRLDPQEVAYKKVFAATKQLLAAGCRILHKKTCSVFRGNIGAEFDAMLDAADASFMVVSLAFPKNGRQTVHGIHFVHGKKLELSEFANDPVHPMRKSNLIEILQSQTRRRVGMIDLDIVRKGIVTLEGAIEAARRNFDYCIVDAENQEDLTILAGAATRCMNLGGSSALAEELPKYWPAHISRSERKKTGFHDATGVLVVAGSLMPQTKAQTAHLQSMGVPTLMIDTRKLLHAETAEKIKQEAVEYLTNRITAGSDALLMADNNQEIVRKTKACGCAFGMTDMETSRMVSALLAEITAEVAVRTNLKKLVIAGGDTAGTICRKLGITGNIVLQEIEPGLPSGQALGREMLIVLKSGSFGTPQFLQKAIEHLKTI
ncbi:MAG: four-carbon acid sugar kinase family protein [Negativicutes bacterium]